MASVPPEGSQSSRNQQSLLHLQDPFASLSTALKSVTHQLRISYASVTHQLRIVGSCGTVDSLRQKGPISIHPGRSNFSAVIERITRHDVYNPCRAKVALRIAPWPAGFRSRCQHGPCSKALLEGSVPSHGAHSFPDHGSRLNSSAASILGRWPRQREIETVPGKTEYRSLRE